MGMFDDLIPGHAAATGPSDKTSPFSLSDLVTGNQTDPSERIMPLEKTALENAASPVTHYWPYYSAIEPARRAELERNATDVIRADSTWDRLKAVGRTALSAVNWAWSPITAAERSLVSEPLEHVAEQQTADLKRRLAAGEITDPDEKARATALANQSTDIHGAVEGITDISLGFAGDVPAIARSYDAVRSAVLSVPESAFVKPFVEAVAPASVDALAGRTASKARESFGDLAHRTEQAYAQVEPFRKFLAKLSPDEQLKFIFNHERGLPHDNEILNKASQTLRAMFDARVEQVHAFGEGHLANVIENYFPHIWQDPKGASDAFARTYSKSPLLGSKAFLKQRVFEYVSDGLAAGFKLINSNPIDMALLKVREMDRYIVGKTLVNNLKEDGTMRFFKPGQIPTGWKAIDDPVARVRSWSETDRGFIERGRFAAPESAARIMNNALNPSAFHGLAVVDALRKAGNALNMTQLGLSAFHLGFTTIDSITSKVALGVKQLSRGDVVEGVKSIAAAPGAPITSFVRGQRLRRAYTHPAMVTPEMRAMADSVAMAGGRIKMPRVYGASAHGSFIDAAKNGTLLREVKDAFKDNGVWRVSMSTAARLAETTSSWMMEGLVPRMKLGVYYDMVRDTLKAHPEMSPDQFRRFAQKHWDSVDNRMGEMVYDNLFWKKTGKDVAHLAVRSVGWNLGTMRELGGGVSDSVKLIDALARGDEAAFTDRMAYLVALPVTTGIMGASINYWLTGEGPKQLKDYFFPRTGKTTKYGTPDRVSLPSYMKDVYEYGHGFGQTVINKTHPMVPLVYEMWSNRDFFGYPITDRHHEDPKQFLEDYITFLAKGSLPFSVQGIMHQADKEAGIKKYLSLIGITPAPGYITSPDQLDALDRKREDQLIRRRNKRNAAQQ